MLTSIYHFENISEYLNAVYKEKKEKSAHFSLKFWCNQLEMPSTGSLSSVLNGERLIPFKYIGRIVENLELDHNEIQYFLTLFLLENDLKPDFKKKLVTKLNPLFWREKEILNEDKVFKTPIIFAIKALDDRLSLDTRNLYNKVRSIFSKDIEDDDLKQACQEVDFLKKTHGDGKRFVTTSNIGSHAIQSIHRYYLKLASKRISNVELNKKEYFNYSLNINESDIPKIQKSYRLFIDSLIEEFDKDIKTNKTYQLGGYLFPLTDK